MEATTLESQDVVRAKAFWAEADVDQVFDQVSEYLLHLKSAFKKNTATDRECVQGMKLLALLDCTTTTAPPPSAGRDSLLAPLTPIQLTYRPHDCSTACLPSLPSMPQSTPPFWGQNPLKVPLLCGFRRLSATPLLSPTGGGVWDWEGEESASLEEDDAGGWDVVYKAPCGHSLRSHDDVMRFLLATESYGVLQVDFFTFNPAVRLDPPRPAGPRRPELDLSRGAEPTPVELCAGEADVRPDDFRYRKDRWPHGCFLSRGPALFAACCDCSDGCLDARRCACLALTAGGRRYSHHRLTEPVPSGLFECGPWCGCERARCQNRLVQRGIRVRLQVFQTADRGWGVRCRDDLDRGTFVCTYAGLVLRRAQTPVEAPPPKLSRAELPSDDEVEVVTEWLAPPVMEGRSNLLESPPTSPPTSPPLHVPVIQRPTDTPQDREKVQAVLLGSLEPKPAAPADQSQGQETVARTTASSQAVAKEASGGKEETAPGQKSVKRPRTEEVYFLDASKEGNVGRFINHSCQPNLFVQNVFTDSHDPAFPLIAFFTSSAVKAGTELTWNCSPDTGSTSQQEAPCRCGSDGCRGRLASEEKLCAACEVKGHGEKKPDIAAAAAAALGCF
uniref:histone-lysine N-methyltransferase SETDB2 n=1 Tax=Centroberyx gerrardi TaxID=166262 RepID=UPI003AAEAD76